MDILRYKAYTPGLRNRVLSYSRGTLAAKPYKKLLARHKRHQGRNHRGIITSGHRGGGHKRLYRQIDFQRRKKNCWARVLTIEYDPNRNSFICLLEYQDGDRRYILYPRGMQRGESIRSGVNVPILRGNALPLSAA